MGKHYSKGIMIIGILVLVGVCVYCFGLMNTGGHSKISAASTLKEVVDISELSIAEYQCNAIAEAYRDENKADVKCRICYSAKVKATVDTEKILLHTDKGNKTITVTLPEIKLNVYLGHEDPMQFLPSNADVEAEEMMRVCEEDALKEAKESTKLMDIAYSNLKKTIEGLLYPIAKTENYTISWNENY